MSLPDNYFDGVHTTPFQHGPTIHWIDEETGAAMYQQTMRIAQGSFASLARGTEGDSGFYLFQESQPNHIEGQLVEWVRMFTAVPAMRIEHESYAHGYQTIEADTLGELVVTVQSALTYDYFLTANPETDITIQHAYRLLQIGGTIVQFGTAPVDTDTELIAQDSTYHRWKQGLNIYERVTRRVPRFTLSELV